MTNQPIILIIEDEAAIRRFVRPTLEAHEYSLLEAETAAQGLQLASQHRPDAILLDLGLPDGDGLDVLTQLRQWSRAPVVIISARDREADKIAALDAGADDYLTKPFGVGELLARVRVTPRKSLRAIRNRFFRPARCASIWSIAAFSPAKAKFISRRLNTNF